jgi:phosphatidylserine/phosphatidylglycerophosphate/cardiolipin synthase-like enzyme
LKRLVGIALGICCAFAQARETAPAPLRLSGTVEIAFTPGGPADRLAIGAIREARREILVQAFSFTHRDIADALIEAHKRGVTVKVIADAEQAVKIRTSVIDRLARGGVPVWLDGEHDAAHNKVMIVDAATVVTGSYNFTHAAQYRNAENLMVLRGNPELARAFHGNWQRHLEHARPHAGFAKNPAND